MTGLDKILKHIEEDAGTAAAKVIFKAKQEAEEIVASAKAEGDKKCKEINARSDQEVKSCLSRAQSAAVLQEKKSILKAKQDIINGIIEKAQNELLNLPTDQYFENILKMVKKHALPEAGTILFSNKDRERLPAQFETSLKKMLDSIPGAFLEVSKETRKIDGGFILIYGEIEENCSFDALFSTAKDVLQDKVCALLFE